MGLFVSAKKPILIEGYSSEEILGLPTEQLKAFVFTGKPLVFKTGSAQILGEFTLVDTRLVIELAHIDGGGEGALPTIAALAEKYARRNNLAAVEWIVHAVHCAKPNPKLRRVLERRGFQIQDIAGYGEAFYLKKELR
jgi:hypothetical protein